MSDANKRPALDRPLSGAAFTVDPLSCNTTAQINKKIGFEHLVHDSSSNFSHEALFRISVTAICHSINWDFISANLRIAFDELGYRADRLVEVNSRDVSRWLGHYYRPERVRAKERAAILRNLAIILLNSYDGDAGKVFFKSKSMIYGPNGLIEQLDNFPCFAEDPQRKKTNVLLHDALRDQFYQFVDADEVKPAIDYHIMRLYLRTGRVIPIHHETSYALMNDISPRPRLVNLLRKAVGDALSLTAFYANTSVPLLNGLEWQIGRDVCLRDAPACETGVLPHSVVPNVIQNNGCPYKTVCRAYQEPELKNLREPEFRSRFY